MAFELAPTLPAQAPRVETSVFGVSVQRVKTPSGDLAFFDIGSGPAILLLHGAPMTAAGFIPLIRDLAVDHRVIAPDLPGFGGSVAADDFPGTLAAYADSVAELIVGLDLSDLCVYLNDTSGAFGVHALAGVRRRVRGIVVADTVPLPLTGRARLVRFMLGRVVTSRLARMLNRRFNMFAWAVARVAPMWRQLPTPLRLEMYAQFDTPRKRDRILDVLAHIAHDTEFIRRAATSATTLSDKPALVLFGQFDPMRFVGAPKRWQSVFRNSTRCIIPLEEHFPFLGSPTRVAGAVRAWMKTIPKTVRR